MTEEEIIKKQAKEAVTVAERYSIRKTEAYLNAIVEASSRLYKGQAKSVFFNEAIRQVKDKVNAHRSTCSKGAGCPTEQKYEEITFYLRQELDALGTAIAIVPSAVSLANPSILPTVTSLIHLHPTVQQVTSSLFASAHYPQALLAACTALDKAVQAKAALPATTVGTALMTTAFSAKSPLIKLASDPNEQMGFMNLYQGSVQAIRNHYAHNITEIPAARALEWLGFISALFYKLDEA